MVTGGDFHSRDGDFESQHQILDGHFSHYIVVKNVIHVSKRPKIKTKRKRSRKWPIFKKQIETLSNGKPQQLRTESLKNLN